MNDSWSLLSKICLRSAQSTVMASNLRSRPSTKPADNTESSHQLSNAGSEFTPSDEEDGPTRLSFLDVLRMLGGLFLISSILSYFITGDSIFWNYRPAFTRLPRIKAWIVSFSSRYHRRSLFIYLRPPARPSRPLRCPIEHIQWDRRQPTYPRRPERHHLRRLRQPTCLRSRRQLPFLRRP